MVKDPSTNIAIITGQLIVATVSLNVISKLSNLLIDFYLKPVDFSVTPDPSRQPESVCEYSFGLFKPSADCDIFYYRCAYGEAEEVACEKGLAYDDRSHSCNWPDLMLDIGCEPESN